MFSVARSRLALPVQLSFLGVHSTGLLLGTIYTSLTPDLYENNSHNRLGWIVTWMVAGQCIIGIVQLAASIAASRNVSSVEERVSFLPGSTEEMAQYRPIQGMHSPDPNRYSNDSGHFTASRSQSVSSARESSEEEQQQKLRNYEAAHNGEDTAATEKHGLLANPKVERFAQKVSSLMSRRTMKVLDFAHNAVDRVILLLGFITFIAGAAVYAGVFVSCIGTKCGRNHHLSISRGTPIFLAVSRTPSKAAYSSGMVSSLSGGGWAASPNTGGLGTSNHPWAWSANVRAWSLQRSSPSPL